MAALPAALADSDFLQALAGITDPQLLDGLVAEHAASPFRGLGGRPVMHGMARADVAVIAEWPTSADGEEAGLFNGAAGLLLERMLGAIGLERNAVLTTSILPVTPPGRGRPASALVETGLAVLRRRLALGGVRKVLVPGGASQHLFGLAPLAARGSWRMIETGDGPGVPALVTLAPAFLLSQPAQKARAWEDLQLFVKGLAS